MWSCNQKERVRKTHSTSIVINGPRRPCSANSLRTYRPLISLTLKLPTNSFINASRIKNIRKQQQNKPPSIPPLALTIHTDASQGTLHIALPTMYIPRKHKLSFHQMFTKLQTSQQCLILLSLSLEFFYSSNLTKLLGAAEKSGIQPRSPSYRASHHRYVHPTTKLLPF
jgi:hypothetical protein